MVPLGRNGDTGTKKCTKCKNREQKENQKRWHDNNPGGRGSYKLKEFTCIKCGKKYQGRRKEICELCELIILDLYNEARNRDCIYCGTKITGREANAIFCSQSCRSKTSILALRRKKAISETLKE
jgi:hypothetical protein